MNTILQDVRYALRQLRKSPGFTFTVVLTLALGIGANAAIFTLFDQVLLRVLPVQSPRELVTFAWSGGFQGSMSSFGGDTPERHPYFSYPMYRDLREKNDVFSGILAAERTSAGISWHNQAENKDAELVSGNYFQLLGLKPAAGRLFNSNDETQKNANAVAVLSYGYWQSRFAAAPGVVGQTLLVNGHPFTIVGIAPRNFDSVIGGYKPGIFVPLTMVEQAIPWRAQLDDLKNHQSVWLTAVARLKPGATRAQAEASLSPLWRSLRTEEFTHYKAGSARFRAAFIDNSHLSVLDDSRGFNPNRTELKKPLFILMSMAGLLVTMCAINVATLLLLRASARAREMAMRYALGAKRKRIVTQLLVEGLLLAIAGAISGLALAPAAAGLLVRLLTGTEPGNEPYSATVDTRMLFFTLALSLVASVLFSIAPLVSFLRPDLVNALRQNAGTASRTSQRFRKIAVGAQIALTVMLLGGAGLFVRTLEKLRTQSAGFEIQQLLTFQLDPSNSGYSEARIPQIMSTVTDALRSIPGVLSVAGTTDPELMGNSQTSNFSIQGYKAAEDERMNFEEPYITPGYFVTLRQPLLAGREFTLADSKGQPKVAVVNLAFAKRFFGTPQNAIGRQIMRGRSDKSNFDTTIVGVVGDIRHTNMRDELGPAVYEPYAQNEHPTGLGMYVRTAADPKQVQASIRRTIQQLDSTLVVDSLRTMDEQVNLSASDERALAFLAVGFSALALLLSAVGMYGVLAYSTEQRTREIGVRLALGASRSNVVGLVLREMIYIAASALILAIPSTIALARLFRSQLYGVTTADPVTMSAAVALTAIMTLTAAALPSFRAAGVQPVRALREE